MEEDVMEQQIMQPQTNAGAAQEQRHPIAIEAIDLVKDYGHGENAVHALRGVNVRFEQGRFTAIMGPSGSGKSTLMHTLAGLDSATSGHIVFDGADITTMNDNQLTMLRRHKIGFIFQSFNLLPMFTAEQNILMPLTLAGQKPDRQWFDMLTTTLGLKERLTHRPNELSGGQQQRVAIARTLAPNPKVLFMDEPLSNLDAKLRLEMRSELQRLHLQTGSTFVYVTHDQMEAMTLATRICLMENGVLQQYDEPLTVYGEPSNLFVADFVGNPAINFIEAQGAQKQDGTVELTMLDGVKAAYTPGEPVNLREWFAREEKNAAASVDTHAVEKANRDSLFKYHIAKVEEDEFEDEVTLTHEDFVIGVRPECVSICENGALEGEIFSAMPTGMETTVKVRVGEFLFTGVVFGGITYKIGQKVRVSFTGENVLLFSRENGKLITRGTLKI